MVFLAVTQKQFNSEITLSEAYKSIEGGDTGERSRVCCFYYLSLYCAAQKTCQNEHTKANQTLHFDLIFRGDMLALIYLKNSL